VVGWGGLALAARLNGVATPFGSLTMELRVAADGKTARLRVAPLPSDTSCARIVVHLGGWTEGAAARCFELDPKTASDRVFEL